MSNREKCMEVINSLPEDQLANIAVILEATKQAIEEAADDAYCMRLYSEYQNSPDKEEGMLLSDFAKSLGVDLESAIAKPCQEMKGFIACG